MFRSYWIIIFAIGLVFSVSFGLAQDKTETIIKGKPISESGQEQSTTNGEGKPESKQTPSVDITPPLQAIEAAIRDLIPKTDDVENQRQIDADTRDLEAQESMAQWAFWMFVATFATVLLTAAALIAIIRTLHHTRRAADYTGDMLIEAKRSADAAFDVVNSDRAWITLGPHRIENSENGIFSPDGIKEIGFKKGTGIAVAVKNSGRSPAVSVELIAKEWVGTGDYPDFDDFLDIKLPDYRPTIVGPNDIIFSSTRAIFDDNRDNWLKRECRFLIYVKCIYRTLYSSDEQILSAILDIKSAGVGRNGEQVIDMHIVNQTMTTISDAQT